MSSRMETRISESATVMSCRQLAMIDQGLIELPEAGIGHATSNAYRVDHEK